MMMSFSQQWIGHCLKVCPKSTVLSDQSGRLYLSQIPKQELLWNPLFSLNWIKTKTKAQFESEQFVSMKSPNLWHIFY